MTIKELYEKYGDVELTEEQVKQIKECLKIKDKKWKPEKRYRYYYINDSGQADYIIYYNNNMDNYRILTNNCFQTIEEAKFKLEQIKVYNELKNFADENNEEIDFKSDTIKYHIFYDYDENKVDVYGNISYQFMGQIYFSTRKLAEQAIEKVGADRIKKYLFGVE